MRTPIIGGNWKMHTRLEDGVQLAVEIRRLTEQVRDVETVLIDGKVVYNDQEVTIPASAIDQPFIDNLSQLIKRIAAATPARKVPSAMECEFCNITKSDCPDRAAGDALEEGETNDF